MTELDAIAAQILQLQDTASLAPPITASHPDFGIDDAYSVAARMLAARMTQDWQPVGRIDP